MLKILQFIVTGALLVCLVFLAVIRFGNETAFIDKVTKKEEIPQTKSLVKQKPSEYTLVSTNVIITGNNSDPIVIYTVKHKSGKVYKFSSYNLIDIK